VRPVELDATLQRMINGAAMDGKVVMMYTGESLGGVTFSGPSGKSYLFSKSKVLVRQEVAEQDVPCLLGTGQFKVVLRRQPNIGVREENLAEQVLPLNKAPESPVPVPFTAAELLMAQPHVAPTVMEAMKMIGRIR